MINREEALQIIWDRCQHCKETEEALKVLKEERPLGEKKCPICGSDLYEYCFMCCYEGMKVKRNEPY